MSPRADYDALYEQFDSPLMLEIRREAYGEDIGQHSWVTAAELRADIGRLGVSARTRLLDLGCGPCGALAFVVQETGCRAVGADVSVAALAAGRARFAPLELAGRVDLRSVDLDDPLPFGEAAFDAVISLDVVLHLEDRTKTFREVARVLAAGGTFLFTDAGVVTGTVSAEEVRLRSVHGRTQFVPPGFSELALEEAGFELLEREDRTASVLAIASGRLSARKARLARLEALEGVEEFHRQQRYLETVIAISQRRAVSRVMYFARRQPPR